MGFFSKLKEEMQKPIGLKYREPGDQKDPFSPVPAAKVQQIPPESVAYDPKAPTERQLAYAKDLGIKVPKGATKTDVSCLISKVTDGEKDAPADMVAFAKGLGLEFSPYVGEHRLFNIIYYECDTQTRASIYAYGIYQYETGQPFSNMLTHPKLDTFKAFGEYVMQDSSLVNSLLERTSDDLFKPYRGTKIYKAAHAFLFEE